jgi:uncharacterized membrane protein YfcA
MAYGITSTSFLLATGSSPAVASASVHIAEVFTTGVSGIAHIKLEPATLFFCASPPAGARAGVAGVEHRRRCHQALSVAAYLLGMGLFVLSKAFRKRRTNEGEPRHVAKLGLVGGFVDAAGGGPVVTTTLVGTGNDPRTTIGSVNLAEFFLTFVSAGVFSMLVEEAPVATVAGLVVGGLFAAPAGRADDAPAEHPHAARAGGAGDRDHQPRQTSARAGRARQEPVFQTRPCIAYTEFDRQFVDARAQRRVPSTSSRRVPGRGALSDERVPPACACKTAGTCSAMRPCCGSAVPYGDAGRQLGQLAHIAAPTSPASRYDRRLRRHFTTRQNLQFNWIQRWRAAPT